jgi:hypothetical protein
MNQGQHGEQPPSLYGPGYAPQGYPPGPPAKKRLGALKIVLAVLGGLFVLGFGSCVICVALGAKAISQPVTVPSASVSAPEAVPGSEVPKNICNKLALAGVVNSCKEPEADQRTDGRTLPDVHVGFDVVGVPTAQGAVTYWLTDAAFQNEGSYPAGDGWVRCKPDSRVKPDDYPDQCVGSPKARIVVTWGTTDNGEWGDCRVPSAGKENPVAVCAKRYPAEYARFHALYDAAKRVVGVP